MDREIGLGETIDATLGHHDNDLSPVDYTLIFIMNRLSDPRSKSGMHEWMQEILLRTFTLVSLHRDSAT